MSFVIGNFRALEPVESGQAHSAVQQFRGEDLTSGLAVSMTVQDADCADDVRSRVSEFAAVRHPHLLAVDEVAQDVLFDLIGSYPEVDDVLHFMDE